MLLVHYRICLLERSSSSCKTTIPLLDVLVPPKDVFSLCQAIEGASNDPVADIRRHCEQKSRNLKFNGDDRIVVFKDLDKDNQWGREDLVMDVLGPLDRPLQGFHLKDVVLSRCRLEPYDGMGFFHLEDYFDILPHYATAGFGAAPEGECG